MFSGKSGAARIQAIQIKPGGLIYYPFYDRNKPNYIFANYWNSSLTIDGITYNTPEHYFQAQKFKLGSGAHKAIVACQSPDDARLMAAKYKNQIGKQWHGDKSYQAMVKVCRARFDKDPAFKKALISTDDGYILEDTYTGPKGGKPDTTWGGGADGKGKNLLGMALMQVRNEHFKTMKDKQNYVIDTEAKRELARDERDWADKKLRPNITTGLPLATIDNELKKVMSPARQQTSSTATIQLRYGGGTKNGDRYYKWDYQNASYALVMRGKDNLPHFSQKVNDEWQTLYLKGKVRRAVLQAFEAQMSKLDNLLRIIQDLERYGEELGPLSSKGQNAKNLAQAIYTEVDVFATNPQPNAKATSKTLSDLITKGKKSMGDNREIKDWVAHFVFACTGVGLIVIVGKALFSQSHSGFLNSTKRQKLLNEIDKQQQIVVVPRKP